MWIARDKDGTLCAFRIKVVRDSSGFGDWIFPIGTNPDEVLYELKKESYPEVTWTSEPKWMRWIPNEVIRIIR